MSRRKFVAGVRDPTWRGVQNAPLLIYQVMGKSFSGPPDCRSLCPRLFHKCYREFEALDCGGPIIRWPEAINVTGKCRKVRNIVPDQTQMRKDLPNWTGSVPSLLNKMEMLRFFREDFNIIVQ